MATFREHIEFLKPDASKKDANGQLDPRNRENYSKQFERFADVSSGTTTEADEDQVVSSQTHTVVVWGDPETRTVADSWLIVWNYHGTARTLQIFGQPQIVTTNPEKLKFTCFEIEP